METLGMKSMAMLLTGLLLSGAAGAGDVYVTTDAQGHPVYTDTPQAVPAQKVDLHVSNPDAAAESQGTAPPAKQPAQKGPTPGTQAPSQQMTPQQAAQMTADDRAQRCVQARQRYQTLMDNWRVYETGPNGERTYLTSEQIDAARVNAKTAMDQFCSDQ
jgi:hypothetical protein